VSLKLHVRLPVLRAERHLTQQQLAQLAGVRPETISDLEREKTSGIQFETLARLCEVLDCAPGDLFEMEPDGHEVPVLGGPDEETILLARLTEPVRLVDGPSFVAELTRLFGDGGDGPEAEREPVTPPGRSGAGRR
jgi:putative transcriptional regulator